MAQTIAVTGKGGTGKTTVAALIVRWLRKNAAGPILALDADPDANLASVLDLPLDKTIGDLREETLQEIRDLPPGMSKENYIEAGLHQIIVEAEKVDLMAMGRSEGPGCYCYINHLLRKFSEDLHPGYEWVVIDNEAGMEHISRQTHARVDHLICVVNQSPLALDSVKRICTLVDSLKNPVANRYLLLNSVRPDRIETVRHNAADIALEYLGAVPWDENLENTIFRRNSVFDMAPPDSPALLKVDEVMTRITRSI